MATTSSPNGAKERPSGFFAACPPAKITPQLAALAAWASSPEKGFKASAISEFLQSADYHLVAHAAAEGYVVVTHESTSAGLHQTRENTGRLPSSWRTGH